PQRIDLRVPLMFAQRPDALTAHVAVGADADQVRSPDRISLDGEAQPWADGCAHEQSGAATRRQPAGDEFGYREPRPQRRPLLDPFEYRPDGVGVGVGRPWVFEMERR